MKKDNKMNSDSDGKNDIREKLMDIAITDALNANRTNDALREALVASFIKKSNELEPMELIAAIKEIEVFSSIEKTKNIISIIDKK